MRKVSKLQYGMIIALIVFVAATVGSFLVLNSLYESRGTPATQSEDVSYKMPGNRIFAVGIGATMGLVALVMWQGSSSIQQDTISIMLHRGLEDLTVRDLEIVRRMMKKEEFTIPELQKHTPASRQSIWRLVKKLEEKELVKKTDRNRLPSSGRGKPSQVYEYIGP